MEQLKRVVIKEELVALTGDYIKALIINQFLYWSKRIKDFDKYIQEENQRRSVESQPDIEKTHGWIYKKAEEINDELMLGASKQTIGRHVQALIDNGWLEKRRNPKYNWDKTFQYRVNLTKIQKDLMKLGFALENYPLFQNGTSEFQNGTSEYQNGTAIPEITSETTNKEKDINTTYCIDDINKKINELKINRKDNPTQYGLTKENIQLVANKQKKEPNDVAASIDGFIKKDYSSKNEKKNMLKAYVSIVQFVNIIPNEDLIEHIDKLFKQDGYQPSHLRKAVMDMKNESIELTKETLEHHIALAKETTLAMSKKKAIENSKTTYQNNGKTSSKDNNSRRINNNDFFW